MAEIKWSGLPEFWKEAPLRYVDDSRPNARGVDGGVTVASTTDMRADVDRAAEDDGDHITVSEDDVIYTEASSVTAPDGTTEHAPCRTYVNGREMTATPPAEDVGPLIVNQSVVTDFKAQVQAARQVLPDFDETLTEQVTIPQAALDAIVAAPNGALLAYHIGKHPAEAEKLFGLSDGQIRRRIVDMSQKLQMNPYGVEPDALPYRAYRKLRDGRG